MKTKIDYLKEIIYSREEYTGKCHCCNRNLKKSYICVIDNEEYIYGKNCLFGSSRESNKIEKEIKNLELKLKVFTNNFKNKIIELKEGKGKSDGKLLIISEKGFAINFTPKYHLKGFVESILIKNNCFNL